MPAEKKGQTNAGPSLGNKIRWHFGGIVEGVTKSDRVVALINMFGRMTPVESEPSQISPAASPRRIVRGLPEHSLPMSVFGLRLFRRLRGTRFQ